MTDIWQPDGHPVILAVVGTRKFLNPDAYSLAALEITAAVRLLEPTALISGGAQGMDTFAETMAGIFGVPFEAFQPAHARWEPDGYKARNSLIAAACTHLLSIRCQGSNTYGSGWTADEAERMGRVVRRVVIPVGGKFTTGPKKELVT